MKVRISPRHALVLVACLLREAASAPESARQQPGYNPNCPIHRHDAIRSGLVPSPYQHAFGTSALQIPNYLMQWIDEPPFNQDFGSIVYQLRYAYVLDPLQRQAFDQPRLKLLSTLEALPAMHNNDELISAVTELAESAAPIRDCFNPTPEQELQIDSGIVNSKISTLCRWNLYRQWHGLRPIARVLDATGNIREWGLAQIERIEVARGEVLLLRRNVTSVYETLADEYERLLSGAYRDDLQWLVDLPKTREFEFWDYAYRESAPMQQIYIRALWLDMLLTSLDAMLVARLATLKDAVWALEHFATRETMKAVLFSAQMSSWQSARAGRIDLFPLRAHIFAQTLVRDLGRKDSGVMKAAACDWVTERMPLRKACTCRDSLHLSHRPRYFYWGPREIDEVDKGRHFLQHWFWEEMRDLVVEYDTESDATIRSRWTDIRTQARCRPAGSKDRPWSPPGLQPVLKFGEDGKASRIRYADGKC